MGKGTTAKSYFRRIRQSVAYDHCASPLFLHLDLRTTVGQESIWEADHVLFPWLYQGAGGRTNHLFGFHNWRQQWGEREGRKEHWKRGKETNSAESLLFVRTFATFFYVITIFYCHLYLYHDILHACSREIGGPFAFACKEP